MARSRVVSCFTNKTFQILNCVCLVLVYAAQSIILNSYMISYSKHSWPSSLWYAGDIGIICLFLTASIKAYMYLSKKKLGKKTDPVPPSSTTTWKVFQRKIFGVLPLCYISWICYAILLVSKICFIYKSEIINLLSPKDAFGPQLLKLSIALSTMVFILLVSAHHDAEKDSQRSMAIKSMCTNTAFELLDSVSLLSLLVIRESHLIFTYEFESIVISFAVMNYFLPTIALYQFSLTDFGQVDRPLDLNGVYHLCHMVLVNIPYLAIRIYLWSGFGSDISLFIMKNVIAILWHLKDIIPDFVILHRQCRALKEPNSETNDIEMD